MQVAGKVAIIIITIIIAIIVLLLFIITFVVAITTTVITISEKPIWDLQKMDLKATGSTVPK